MKTNKYLVKAVIYCPYCGHRHIDRDEWSTDTKKHHKHLCTPHDGGCGGLFKVDNSDVYYVGV